MPLTAELEYFLENINSEEVLISNAHNGCEVIRVLTKASEQLLK